MIAAATTHRNDRAFALEETQRLREACARIQLAANSIADLRSQQSQLRGRGAVSLASTFGRELMYAVAHAIHHYALIAVMCGLLGVRVPFGFGIAPSTLQHQAEQEKAA